jgi:hypothetical protein
VAGRAVLSIEPAQPVPHFVQVGDVPVFEGAGIESLTCRCGSVLIRGYLAANFRGIRIQCFRCGEITATPDLPLHEILPRSATPVAASQSAVVTTMRVGSGSVLACSDAVAGDYALTRPVSPPDAPIRLSRELLETAAADYDRITGGRLSMHLASSPPGAGSDHGGYPFAWAVLRLRELIDRPDWSWLYHDDDAMAALYVMAVHNLMACWGEHPLLTRLAAPLASRDRFIQAVATLGMAKLLYEGGNRVGFLLSGDAVGLYFTAPSDVPLSFALLAPEALQWRRKDRCGPDIVLEAIIEAIASAQGMVNRSRPGVVVLAASIVQPDFDRLVHEATAAALQLVGRRYRGVAAVAIAIPKVVPVTGRPDQIGFGYAFYPVLNPRFVGENPIRLDPARDPGA